MARTARANAETAKQRRVQALIRTVVQRRLTALWPMLDPLRLDETSPAWVAAAVEQIRGWHALSARAAASYFLAYRLAEGVVGTPPPLVAPVFSLEAVKTSLIVTGPVALKKSTANGVPFSVSVPNAQTMTLGAAGRHVQQGGWDMLDSGVRSDDQAQGWARVASGDACAFCLMLAGRGPVYKSEETVAFEAHDHEACGLEPVFENYQWNSTAQRAAEAWQTATDRNGEWWAEYQDSIMQGEVLPPGVSSTKYATAAQRSSALINGPFRQYLARNPI